MYRILQVSPAFIFHRAACRPVQWAVTQFGQHNRNRIVIEIDSTCHSEL